MLQKYWRTRVFLIVIVLLTVTVNSHRFQTFSEALTNYTEFFQVSQSIQLMKNYSSNQTFNSTRQRFMFVFYPLMGKCVQGIQQESEAVMQSIKNSGIGAGTYVALAGAKIAAKAGIWKFGFASLLKAAALSTLSMSFLPIIVGVGAASYFYKDYKKQQLKNICRDAMKQIENFISGLQLKQLRQIKRNTFKNFKKDSQRLNYRIKVMDEFPQIYRNFFSNVKKYKAKEIMLRNYFKNFIKITKRY